ncbi:hypothetical protein MTO96_006607 [Rhipicephalus appendiculatus]
MVGDSTDEGERRRRPAKLDAWMRSRFWQVVSRPRDNKREAMKVAACAAGGTRASEFCWWRTKIRESLSPSWQSARGFLARHLVLRHQHAHASYGVVSEESDCSMGPIGFRPQPPVRDSPKEPQAVSSA